MERRFSNGSVLRLMQGDITKVPADAIANAANSSLAGGGGVDGAIHRAGGPSIMRELDGIRARQGGCPTGSCVVTGAGNLPAKWVLHAVGPVYRDGSHGEPELLRSCYTACMKLADGLGAASISFPAISTGVYGYPIDEAAAIAVSEVAEALQSARAVKEARFVLYGDAAFRSFSRALAAVTLE
jgi:O-acetyl-ADP-ribose deacetylase (regulator of RNase III)